MRTIAVVASALALAVGSQARAGGTVTCGYDALGRLSTAEDVDSVDTTAESIPVASEGVRDA